MSEPGLAYRAVDASLGALSHLATSIDNSLRPVTANANAYSRDPDQEVNAATAVIEGFRRQLRLGIPIAPDIQAVYSVVDAIQNSKSLDDRKMLLEHALVFMSRLPRGSALAQKGQDAVISMRKFKYIRICPSPATYVGDAYRFRAADGGNNNLLIPDLDSPPPSAELPDPELVFECLLKRDKVTPHPAGLSAMFFSFATLVIHTCFRTNHRDVTINETSSYVDLAPLYGNNQEDQDSVRRWDGTGRLKEDVFTENRLLFLPPAVCTILGNSAHATTRNLAVHRSQAVPDQRGGQFRDPETLKEEQRKQQDHVLFNTARLINVGFFVSIVLGDYLASILGIVREGSDWSLNPFQDIVQSERNHVPRGKFNLLYHWHSTTSAIDEQWTEGVFRKIFGDKPFEQITPGEFAKASALVASAEPDKAKWEFGGMKRGSDGRFNDAELAQTIINATSHVASAFKARGTPPVLRVVEILGIMSSRKWGVCSLNEFRKFIGLKPYDSFTEWNSDPEIATAAMRLYKHPDNLELYVGLQAEETKPVVPGAGLCPGYTISRAILSDAITLTRGDRYLTTDWTTNNLTCWGFDDATRDIENPSFGGMLGKLFYRTLPGQFPENSIYLWFPLMTPDAMKTNFTKVGIAGDYDFSRPTAPQPVQDVTSRAHVMDVIMETACIHTPYGKKVQAMFDKDPGFFLALNDEHDHTFKTIIYQNLIAPSGTYFQSYFYEVTKTLLQDMSYTLGSHQSKCLDIVDVFENVVMRFVSEEIGGLSLKSESNPRGLYFERELRDMIDDIYMHVFTDIDIQHIFRIAKNAKSFSKRLLLHINQTYIAANGLGPITERIFGFFSGTGRPSYDFMRRLHKTGKPKDQLCKAVLAAIVASFEYVPALINVVNFYLDPAQAEHKTQLVALASSKDPQANNVIAGYVREALRLDPLFSHARRVVVENTSVKGSNYKRGDSLFLSIADSNLDVSPLPFVSVDPRRPADSYTLMGDGLHRCFSDEFVHSTMACAVRAVFQLNNIRRGPGKSGILKRFTDSDGTTASSCYLNSKQIITPFPTSLTLQYDV
ncbi:Linoleate diol synthase [Rhizoctonia solani]|uniref:Linoleate diol synthase n=1 Tax=Rhizoctonia solani TaxID=456999 RepID=A0A8H7ILW5_9AGAM|nr:Linoleate diol synthase [Rhizoctonia solani]